MKLFSILLLAFTSFTSSNIETQNKFDTEKSVVNFTISNMGLMTVNGSFTNFKGVANFNANEISKSSFSLNLAVSGIDTKNEKRDEHLQAKEYFDAASHPNISFTSSSVAAAVTGINITGKLKMKGVTKEITIPFTYESAEGGYLLVGDFKIDRFDFGVGGSGSFAMGREVNLAVKCFVKK